MERSAKPLHISDSRLGMEHQWSQAVATGGNQRQMGEPRKRLGQAKTVATGCDRLPIGAHGKDGVDGSSPSEGLNKALQIGFCVACDGALSIPGEEYAKDVRMVEWHFASTHLDATIILTPSRRDGSRAGEMSPAAAVVVSFS
jgi:hypothetical protein